MLFSLKELSTASNTDIEAMLLANWFFESNQCTKNSIKLTREKKSATIYARKDGYDQISIGSINTNKKGDITSCIINGKKFKADSYQSSGLYYNYQIGDDKYNLAYGKYKAAPKRNHGIMVSTPNLRKNGEDDGKYLIINDVICFKFPPNTTLEYKTTNAKSNIFGLPIRAHTENGTYTISYKIVDGVLSQCIIFNKEMCFLSSIQFSATIKTAVDIAEYETSEDDFIHGDIISEFKNDKSSVSYHNFVNHTHATIDKYYRHYLKIGNDYTSDAIYNINDNPIDCVIMHDDDDTLIRTKYIISGGM